MELEGDPTVQSRCRLSATADRRACPGYWPDAYVKAALTGGEPLVACELLNAHAQTYGIMLRAFGFRVVIGAINIGEVRRRMAGEAAMHGRMLSMGGATVALRPLSGSQARPRAR
ncbi:MFS transporter [Bradyrhizobium brasilense]|uniref:hypothetical protein n=1 Tax=Bradyrhizobium brasilense TaxID=1419277 RepID=UPI002877ACB3|nr:hypothetical protein [Bradyrhizobium brasilense]MCP3420001.1 MFS transporter [Bradyrhizobium brasilense]